MNRFDLLEKLQWYLPVSEEEINFKQRTITFMQENSQCFERSLAIGHITASCWLLNKKGTHALLMHHAKLNKWFQLGGHCDGNQNVLEVALKEAQEESGIMQIAPLSSDIFDVDVHRIPENSCEKAHYHYDIRFLLQVISDEQIVQNSESKELRWIAKDFAALPTQNQSVVRMFKKWMAINF